jgi:hypothetical protein
MDRDPKENAIDPEERVTSTTGASSTGESGDARARESADEEDEGAERDEEPPAEQAKR